MADIGPLCFMAFHHPSIPPPPLPPKKMANTYIWTYMPECSGKQHKLNTYFVKHVSHRESQSEPDAFSTNVSATQEIKSSFKRSASSDNDKSKYVNRQTEIWAREAQC